MARRKNAKRTKKSTAKQTAKRTTAKKSLSATQKIEQSLLEVPAKLAAILDKEVISLKKKEDSLKQAIKKTTSKCNAQEKQLKAAEKAKPTPASKKKVAAQKKNQKATQEALNALEKALHEATAALNMAKQNQLKAAALRKHIIQFEKDWAEVCKAMPAQQPKAKAKKKPQAKKATASKQPMMADMNEEANKPEFDHFDIAVDHNELDEKSNLN